MPESVTAPPPQATPTVAATTTTKSPAAPTKGVSSPPLAGDKPSDIVSRHEPDDPFKDAFAEIDEEAGKETIAEDKRNKGERADKQPKPVDDKAVIEKKPTEQKPKENEPKTPKELRDVYNALKEKVAREYEPQLKELSIVRAKLKDAESKDELATKSTQDRLVEIEKRNAELESHIRFADYKQTKEYKELESSLRDTWSGAMRKLGGISISRTNPETGDVIERELTIEDLSRYARLDPKLVWKELKQEIPDAAERTTVINHIQKIQDISDSVFKAEEKAKSESEAHAKTQTETQRQSQAQRTKLWKATNEELATKYPKWFGKDETDTEGNIVFDKGASFSDLVFDTESLTPERIEMLPQFFKDAIKSAKPLSQEALVRLHAIARNKLANHDRLARSNKTLSARVSELEKSLKEYEQSGPDSVAAGNGHRAKDGPLSADDEFDSIARGN